MELGNTEHSQISSSQIEGLFDYQCLWKESINAEFLLFTSQLPKVAPL